MAGVTAEQIVRAVQTRTTRRMDQVTLWTDEWGTIAAAIAEAAALRDALAATEAVVAAARGFAATVDRIVFMDDEVERAWNALQDALAATGSDHD